MATPTHYIQFRVATPGKYDGQSYKAGAIFPYDPENLTHVRAYEQKRLTARKVANKTNKGA